MSNIKALIMVDLQNDFCQGGSLAVPDADALMPIANELQHYFDLVIATKDWHPLDHMSFASNHAEHGVGDVIIVDNIPQVLWPVHCVQGTNGSDFHPALDTTKVTQVFHKGVDKAIDSYSAFFDNEHLRSTGLGDYLRTQNVKDIYIMGLATDYCVKYSTMDALKLGFNVYVIIDACRGIDLKPGDLQGSIDEMAQGGAQIIHVQDVVVTTE